MEQINLLIKPVSGNCNLNCTYCFYKDEMAKREQAEFGFMTEEILEEVIRRALGSGAKSCTIGFQGGEPMLAGLPFYRKALQFAEQYAEGTAVEFTIQTNGLLMDREWAEFFAQNQFLVGLSLDGMPEVHDKYRGKGTFRQTEQAIRLLQEQKAEFNILTVVTEQAAQNAEQIYRWYKKQGLRYLQFIPCMDPLGEAWGIHPYSLKPGSYGRFLANLFDCWHADVIRGDFVYIRYFENLIGMLLGAAPESCNMRGICSMQNVIEADGSVYPCDFYVLDQYRLGNIMTDSFQEMLEKFGKSELYRTSRQKNDGCMACRWNYLCRGGCMRNRDPHTGRDVFCKEYHHFFRYAYPRLREIAQACM